MAIANYYIECTKYTSSITYTNTGRYKKTQTSSTIYGYLGSKNDVEITTGNKSTIKTQWKFFTSDFNLHHDDIVEYQNNKYEVIALPKNTANKDHHIRAIVQMIDKVKQ